MGALARGWSIDRIAEHLGVSRSTVVNDRKAITKQSQAWDEEAAERADYATPMVLERFNNIWSVASNVMVGEFTSTPHKLAAAKVGLDCTVAVAQLLQLRERHAARLLANPDAIPDYVLNMLDRRNPPTIDASIAQSEQLADEHKN